MSNVDLWFGEPVSAEKRYHQDDVMYKCSDCGYTWNTNYNDPTRNTCPRCGGVAGSI